MIYCISSDPPRSRCEYRVINISTRDLLWRGTSEIYRGREQESSWVAADCDALLTFVKGEEEESRDP